MVITSFELASLFPNRDISTITNEEIIKKNPGTSLRDVYLDLACKVSDSHVHLYNMENYGRVYTERMSEFFALP